MLSATCAGSIQSSLGSGSRADTPTRTLTKQPLEISCELSLSEDLKHIKKALNQHARQETCSSQPQVTPDKFGDEILISLAYINVQNTSVFPPGVAQYVLI